MFWKRDFQTEHSETILLDSWIFQDVRLQIAVFHVLHNAENRFLNGANPNYFDNIWVFQASWKTKLRSGQTVEADTKNTDLSVERELICLADTMESFHSNFPALEVAKINFSKLSLSDSANINQLVPGDFW